MIFLILYVITALLWTLLAYRQQIKIFPETKDSLIITFICLSSNFLLCPIAMIFHMINYG